MNACVCCGAELPEVQKTKLCWTCFHETRAANGQTYCTAHEAGRRKIDPTKVSS